MARGAGGSAGGDGSPSPTQDALRRAAAGDGAAVAELVERFYEELREVAGRIMSGEKRSHSLQATELVHQAFLKVRQGAAGFESRRHFVRTCALAMRQILCDHHKARSTRKRGEGRRPVPLESLLDQLVDSSPLKELEHVDLEDSLARLQEINEPAADLFSLRLAFGMGLREAGEELGVGPDRAKTLSNFALRFLRRRAR